MNTPSTFNMMPTPVRPKPQLTEELFNYTVEVTAVQDIFLTPRPLVKKKTVPKLAIFRLLHHRIISQQILSLFVLLMVRVITAKKTLIM